MAKWLLESIVSAVLIVLSVILYILAGNFGAALDPKDIGPAAFPRLMLALVAVFSALQIVLSLKARKKALLAGKEEETFVVHNQTALAGICALMVLYGFLIPMFGFYFTTPPLTFLVMLLMGNRKWLQMVLVSLGFILFLYLVFDLLLGVRLP